MSELEPKLPQDPKELEIGALAVGETATQSVEICQLGVESDLDYLLPNLRGAQGALSNVLAEFAQHTGKQDNIAMVRRGAQFVASLSNSHQGYAAGRQIYLYEHDHYLNNTYERHIIPAAAALRKSRTESHKVASDFDELNGNDDYSTQARYQIFKAITYNQAQSELSEQAEVSPAVTLSAVIAMQSPNIKQRIVQEIKKGGFDRLIAYDLLKMGDTNAAVTDDNIGKVHQLLEHARAIWQLQGTEVGQIESYLKMLETFDNWPTDYRYVVIGVRQALLERFEDNLGQVGQLLTDENIIAAEDPKTAFAESYAALDERLSFSTKVQKRRTRKPAEELPATVEQDVTQEIQNPKRYKAVMCHLAGREATTDDVDDFIAKLTKDVGQNNDGKFHEDVLSLKKYLEHLNLVPLPDGIKSIATCRYVYLNGKKYSMYEAKPKDITGVRTSGISGNMRAFFIILEKPGSDSRLGTLGIIDIVDKKNVGRTLNRIRRQASRNQKRRLNS